MNHYGDIDVCEKHSRQLTIDGWWALR